GVTKVSVGLVVDLRRTVSANPAETPTQDFAGPAYLFPDSSDRTTCVALIPAWLWTGTLLAVKPPARNPRVEDWLRSGLGPCAFYAAYGAPGKGVRRWLTKRGYDLAGSPACGGANASSTAIAIWQRWRGRWVTIGSCGSGVRRNRSTPPSQSRSRCRWASGPSAGSAASCRGSRSGRPRPPAARRLAFCSQDSPWSPSLS